MFKRIELDNGIPVVMERMDTFRSVSLGIWVKTGSRYEPPALGGISHFLEHMYFKGTERRDAREIAVYIDSLGGEMNAFTAKEMTAFYVKVLDEHLPKGIELLGDIFLNSTFPEDELRREASVVLEELRMVEDMPEDQVHDFFSTCTWGDTPLGQPVLGTAATVGAFTRDDLLGYIAGHYGAGRIIVSCAGNFEETALIRALNGTIGALGRRSEPPAIETPEFLSRTRVHEKDLSEAHICLGVRGISQGAPERYALMVLNTILGGGISSRLFQEIRERRGLAYTVYSYMSSHVDTGTWGVYAGTGRETAREVIGLIVAEMRGLSGVIGREDIERAKEQIKGGLVLGLESTSRRMQNLANQEIYYGRYYSPEEIMQAVDRVGWDEVMGLHEGLMRGGLAMTVLGPVSEAELSGVLD